MKDVADDLALIVRNAISYIKDLERQINELKRQAAPDLPRCPRCGGPADNGHDREVPPNPYWCSKCMAEPVLERNFCPRCGKRSFPDTIHTCTPP